MTAPMRGGRLRQLITQTAGVTGSAAARAAPSGQERCELCGEPAPDQHRHLLDRDARRLCCVCRACSVLFDPAAAGGGHYRLVPDRRWLLTSFALSDAAWARLRIPVEMAFFFHDSAIGRAAAFYPSPAGAVQSLIDPAWEQIAAANPVLAQLQPDVEALLVNRVGGARDCWLAPIDDCYSLVGLIRAGWKGLSGGRQVWEEINQFFTELASRARPMNAQWSDGRAAT